MKTRALASLFAAALAAVVSMNLQTPARAADEAKPQETREMLSAHETVAVFEGTREHRCMGRTSLCPDRCGDSGTLAVFKITGYLDYQKPGQYGDGKADSYMFMTANNMGNKKVGDEMAKRVAGLKKGDAVLLSWQHDYVTRTEGKFSSKFPDRTVTKLQKITRLEGDKLLQAKTREAAAPGTTAAPPPAQRPATSRAL